MKVNEMQLYSALNEFIEREIMPLGASMDMTKQFLFGLKIGVVKHKIQSIIKSYINKDEMKILEIVDTNGLIDVEPIYQSAIDMMAKMQKVEVGGFTFKESDLHNLYSIVQRYAN